MAKDPAFLLYSKDWLEGTAEMTAEEKGVYIDLLAHQHQKGSLPSEIKKLAKLSGMSEPEFLKIWAEIGSKFLANASGRLVNHKLAGIVSERLDKGWRNKIVGTLGSIIRYSGLSKDIAYKVKQTFKVDDFLACTNENLSERLSEWYDKRLKSIANANEDAIEDGNVLKAGMNTVPSNGKFEFDLKTELPGKTLESAELNQFTQHKNKNTEFIKSQWIVFLHERINDPPEIRIRYQKLYDLTSYFLNWIRPKSPQKSNGTHQRGNQPTKVIPGIVTEGGTRGF